MEELRRRNCHVKNNKATNNSYRYELFVAFFMLGIMHPNQQSECRVVYSA